MLLSRQSITDHFFCDSIFWQWTATLWRHVGGSSSSVRLRHKRSAFNRWRLGDIGLGPYILRLQHYIVVIVPSKRQLRQHVQEKIVARLQFCDIFALVIYFVIFILFFSSKNQALVQTVRYCGYLLLYAVRHPVPE